MKKAITVLTGLCLALSLLAGCGSTPAPATSGGATPSVSQTAQGEDFDTSIPITVVSREDGSGTRGAFVELLGILSEDDEDLTITEAVTVSSTAVVMTTVAGNPYGIGYISLGSLNDTVKALDIDGVTPTVESVKDGSYAVSRPFNIATKEGLSEVAQDFIDFILSAEGQSVVQENGYIPLDDAPAYAGGKPGGKVVVAGSSSVTPVMEKLKEAYAAINPDAEIEIQQSDSSIGMSAAADGICDIGMASRELKDSELEAGLTPTVIAMDGIAVIVNNANPITGLSSEQVRSIYVGDATTWADVA